MTYPGASVSDCPACGKGPCALLYCRRGDCPRLYAGHALPAPKPDVSVTTRRDDSAGTHHVDVTISRDSARREYKGAGATTEEATRQVIEQIVVDPYSAEWQPPPKKP